MHSLQPFSSSIQLRESYIGISRFVRSLTLRGSHPNEQCRHFSNTRQRALCRSQQLNIQPSLSFRETLGQTQLQETDSSSAEPTANPHEELFQRYLLNNAFQEGATHWDELQHRIDQRVVLHGYVTSQRRASKDTRFLDLVDPTLRRSIQLIVSATRVVDQEAATEDETKEGGLDNETSDSVDLRDGPKSSEIKIASSVDEPATGDPRTGTKRPIFEISATPAFSSKIRPHTPVRVVGKLLYKSSVPPLRFRTTHGKDAYTGEVELRKNFELQVFKISPLNAMPDRVIPKHGATLGPHERHFQFRTDSDLRNRIRLRSRAMALFRKGLFLKGFDEIETPLLFRSTPEGAREFIVPTRQKGLAYALPQSPQQYKQMLMASGFHRYFQFAKCFRDEDMRADRQPEFTQLDLEMSFSSPHMVMKVIESLLNESILPTIRPNWAGKMYSVANRDVLRMNQAGHFTEALEYTTMQYQTAMAKYGSDKPDLRIRSQIHRTDWIPPNLKQMLSSLEDPTVEMIKIEMNDSEPEKSKSFVSSFMDSSTAVPYVQNPHGSPGLTVFDPQKPLNGLASLGHEAAARVEELFCPQPGDILIMQCRPNEPFSGSSTMLGNLRVDLYYAAIEKGLIPPLTGYRPVWIVDFPLFTKQTEVDEGQVGGAGLSSTHHPFTAPKVRPPTDLEASKGINDLKGLKTLHRLLSDPLQVVGDHFDLVINGVEVGGGSRRIHDAKMQEFVLREVLQLKTEQVENFRHLLNALNAGCPPHTGFALGFDRLMALLSDVQSVRDVIAYPKYGNGVDHTVKSPAPITDEQLGTYHLAISESVNADTLGMVSLKT